VFVDQLLLEDLVLAEVRTEGSAFAELLLHHAADRPDVQLLVDHARALGQFECFRRQLPLRASRVVGVPVVLLLLFPSFVCVRLSLEADAQPPVGQLLVEFLPELQVVVECSS